MVFRIICGNSFREGTLKVNFTKDSISGLIMLSDLLTQENASI